MSITLLLKYFYYFYRFLYFWNYKVTIYYVLDINKYYLNYVLIIFILYSNKNCGTATKIIWWQTYLKLKSLNFG